MEHVAHVICCNDSVEFVVIDNEVAAKDKIQELAEENYVRNRWNFKSYEEYRKIYYWHIHSVGVSL